MKPIHAIDGVVQTLEAISHLKTNSGAVVTKPSAEAEEIIEWLDGNPDNITLEQINAKKAELQTEYEGLAYSRAREESYPITKEFIEAYTEKEIGEDSTKWDAYVVKYNKVRSDNQKP